MEIDKNLLIKIIILFVLLLILIAFLNNGKSQSTSLLDYVLGYVSGLL